MQNTPVTFTNQSVELPGTKRPGQTGIFRRADYVTGLLTGYIKTPEVKTMHDVFMHAVKISGDREFLGERKVDPSTGKLGSAYVWETYNQIEKRVHRFGSGLVHLHTALFGLKQAARQWGLGIFANTRLEWTVAGFACSAYDLFSVGLYDTLGPDAVNFGIEHSETPILVTGIEHIAALLNDSPKLPTLKIIISIESLSSAKGLELRNHAKRTSVQLYDWAEVEAIGAKHLRPYTPATPESVFTHCYTSGTTGNPKAGIITQLNILSVTTSMDASSPLDQNDTTMHFLPLPHVFGRIVEMAAVYGGGRLGYSGPLTMMEDFALLQPTYFATPPRVLNRLHTALLKALNSGPAEQVAFAKKALQLKLDNLKNGKGNVHPELDAKLFSKLKAAVGGKIRLILVGSAPTPVDVLAFLRVAFSCDIIEGYGQTEGCGGACITLLNESTAGHVGPPAMANELKLVDVPSLNYFATDKPFPRGELCIRGGNVIPGYHKDPKKTKETIDEEGWLHSGDVASVDNFGRVTIIDRIKNVFKLAQGEFVAVERIENLVTVNVPILQQLMVHGVGTESFLICVGTIEPDLFIPFAKQVLSNEPGMDKVDSAATVAPFLNHPKLRKAVVEQINNAGKKTGLKGFEIPKAIKLLADPFTIENDMLTPTSKVKRQGIVAAFKQELTDMYADTNASMAKL